MLKPGDTLKRKCANAFRVFNAPLKSDTSKSRIKTVDVDYVVFVCFQQFTDLYRQPGNDDDEKYEVVVLHNGKLYILWEIFVSEQLAIDNLLNKWDIVR